MYANVYETRRIPEDNAVVLPFTIALVPDKVLDKTVTFKGKEQPFVGINIFDTGVKNTSVVDMQVGIATATTPEMKMPYPFYIKAWTL